MAQDTTIRRQQVRFWLLVLLVTAFCIWLLRGVLLPFVAGAAIAFFLHPLADRLERWVGRNLAALLLVVLFILLLAALLAFLAPIVVSQLGGLIANLPSYVDALGRLVDPMVEWARRHLGEEQFQQIREQFGSAGGQIMSVIGSVVGGVWQSSVAMISLLSLLLITPVVAFYLLRDWNRMMEAIKAYLPVNRRETIIDLGRQVDATLAGFLRGQGLVCVILGTFYAVALTIAGLNFAVVIGLISGLLTFIPYVGSITGFVLSMGIAFAQFDVWWMWVIIAAIFLFGQAVEGNIITPKLVGDAVNLHAVWVIFALMAGGALFGFTGVLLAVPVAAVIGVLIRFGLRVYRESKYFDPDHLLDEDETADVAGPDSSKPSAREQGHDR